MDSLNKAEVKLRVWHEEGGWKVEVHSENLGTSVCPSTFETAAEAIGMAANFISVHESFSPEQLDSLEVTDVAQVVRSKRDERQGREEVASSIPRPPKGGYLH